MRYLVLVADDPLGYSSRCPAKRKRAPVKTDPPRDTRMGLRRISVRGRLKDSPAHHPANNILSFPQCLENFGGLGAEPPIKNERRHELDVSLTETRHASLDAKATLRELELATLLAGRPKRESTLHPNMTFSLNN